ncbi:MAG: uroporphyrinogen decarboxylase [Reyranellaceae bacterium]
MKNFGPDRPERIPGVLWVLRGERLRPPPIWLMRQAGRYLPEYRELRARAPSFLDFCYTPELAVEATLQPIRRFDLDAAIIFSDILVVPHAIGRPVEFREGIGPVLEPLAGGEVPEFDSEILRRHLASVYEAIARTRSALGPGKPLIGFAGAPWTLACYMVDGQNRRDRFAATRRYLAEHPAQFEVLIDVLTRAVIAHVLNQIEAGAQIVQLFDSWAEILLDIDMAHDKALEHWSVRPMRRIADAVHERHPGVPVIAFPRGVGEHLTLYAEGMSFAGISVDESVSAEWAAEHLQRKTAVQGNLSNETLVEGGARMRREIEAIQKALGRGPFIFNLAHGVLPHTPPEHVAELVRLVRGQR